MSERDLRLEWRELGRGLRKGENERVWEREEERQREERVLSHVEMRGTSVIAAMGTSKYFWGRLILCKFLMN